MKKKLFLFLVGSFGIFYAIKTMVELSSLIEEDIFDISDEEF